MGVPVVGIASVCFNHAEHVAIRLAEAVQKPECYG